MKTLPFVTGIGFACVLSMSLSCSMLSGLGPKANIQVVQSEIKNTKKVGKIIVPAPLGVSGEKDVNAYLGATLSNYTPPQAVPVKAINGILRSIGAPGSLGDILVVSYQAEYQKLVDQYHAKTMGKKKKAPFPKKMTLPNKKLKGFKTPKSQQEAKALVEEIKNLIKGVGGITKAIATGDQKALMAELEKNERLAQLLNQMSAWVFDKVNASYIVLASVKGSQSDYQSGKPVFMYSAMVNVKTGQLRYFAKVDGKKGDIPLPFTAQVAAMANSAYSGAEDKAPLPES